MKARADKLKARIIDSTSRLFFERGFSRVSMDQIASGLGISKKTLYQHFPSKQALLYQVVSSMMNENGKIIEDIVNDRGMDFHRKLSRLMNHLSGVVGRMARPFGEDLRRNAPEMWEEIDRFRKEKILLNFRKLLESGIRQGVFRKDVDPQLMTLMFATLMQNMIDPKLFSQIPFTASQVFETIVEVVFRGILTEPARKDFMNKVKEVSK
ncbi:MAG: TetR/AcrR family transcriptional regulator [Candidatus Edwardsbacteria bacterium]|nr:TetR/AcrR family transcriptional regulator [Candidatus Edwardsbacteria bacterium]